MIVTFKDHATEKFFAEGFSTHLPHTIQRTALRKLWLLNAAKTRNDLQTPPGNHLEQLRGKQSGQYSIRINQQWRICFYWNNGHAFDVCIIDYHK